MQRMSGIASDTNRYVEAVKGLNARIVDTRKTVPGHRYLDKYSVRMGGGYNHRLNLADGILIKDNHIQANRYREMGLKDVIQLALARASHTIKVEVEVESMDQVKEALEAGADCYIQLPCELSELTFNVWSLMRRTGKRKSASDSEPLTGGA